MNRIRRLLDRLPHDTLHVGGQVYMRRWYLFGYAPTPDDPDARMICATCRFDLALVEDWHSETPGTWEHAGHGAGIQDADHAPVAISAERPGWWWTDHGLGAVRIHEIVASDDSRAFHDHPWPFLSILLRGSYVEIQPGWGLSDCDGVVVACPSPGEDDESIRRYRAPTINRKHAMDLHVLTVERGPVWTLFLTRPKVRSWGFAGPFGWLPWRSFDKEFPERDAWTS